ncbi:MAG: hypothetical protein ABSG03_24040 [Bryobacteraceae bacterium]|jgi:hypothetical protein
MIYTCYEMARDCRADKPEGWSHFISSYVPLVRKFLAHYGGGDIEPVLKALRNPGSSMFQSAEPAPERWFLAELRQKVLAEIPFSAAQIVIDLETVAEALAPLTVVEKLAAWLETMRYDPKESGAILRMSPETVAKIRDRAEDLIRGKVDAWRRNLLAENGRALGVEAAAAKTGECLPVRAFLDVLDGRATWRGREEMERHVTRCWHCIDHFCRMAEVIQALRGVQPLTVEESEPLRILLGVRPERARWKRLVGLG